MRHSVRILSLLSLALLGPIPEPARAPTDVLGRWRGTSTCVVAPWNASCNNEIIVYRFEALPTGPAHVMLHASKVINGLEESMGDLECAFDEASGNWLAPFANARVSIVWSYRAHADSMVGTLTILPDRRLARHMMAVRDSQ